MIPKTKNGYGFFEATSAMQKAIRRGDEKVAIYFAVEFFNSGLEEYLWKKLKFIASEDIGLAAPMMPVVLAALRQSYVEARSENKEGRPERMYLIHALLLMVRAKKSRLCDYWLISAWRGMDPNFKMEVPDYAYDMHTLKGKRLGRGLDHFMKEGAKINNAEILPEEQEMKKKAQEAFEKNPGKLKFETTIVGNRKHQGTMFGAFTASDFDFDDGSIK